MHRDEEPNRSRRGPTSKGLGAPGRVAPGAGRGSGPGIHSVTRNQPVRLNTVDGFDAKAYSASTMYWVAQEVTGAGEYWNDGYTGKGVDVALLDSGVVEVDGLGSGNVVYGPDLS